MPEAKEHVMKKGKKSAEIQRHDEELDELEIPVRRCEEAKLILKREPPPRKEQLMAYGVKEIRCVSCIRIKPIAGAEEAAEGWICGDCLSESMQEPKYAGQRGR